MLARFISQDRIGFRGGINSFAYAANNPVRFSDPSGLDKWKKRLDCAHNYVKFLTVLDPIDKVYEVSEDFENNPVGLAEDLAKDGLSLGFISIPGAQQFPLKGAQDIVMEKVVAPIAQRAIEGPDLITLGLNSEAVGAPTSGGFVQTLNLSGSATEAETAGEGLLGELGPYITAAAATWDAYAYAYGIANCWDR